MPRFPLLLLAIAAGCGDSPPAEPDGSVVGEPVSCGGEPCAYVISTLLAPRIEDRGIVVGMDLDERVSDEEDPVGCGHRDFTAPDTTPGIDNQFAKMVDSMEAAHGRSLDEGLRDLVYFGEFLFLVELGDPTAAGVQVEAGRGELATESGHPVLDPRGNVVDGQTYTRGETSHSGVASVSESLLDAEVGDVELPPFSEGTLPLRISDARLQVPFVDGSPARGLLSGRLRIEDLIVQVPLVGGGYTDNRGLLEAVADLDPNAEGVCQAISVAFEVELVRARIEP